jgi:hypothetical protein
MAMTLADLAGNMASEGTYRDKGLAQQGNQGRKGGYCHIR